MSQLFASGGQSIGVSALASFLPKKSQGSSPSEWTGWNSLQSKGLSRVFSNTKVTPNLIFTFTIIYIFFLHFPFLQSKNLIATIWSKKTVTERSVFSCIQTNTQTFGHFMDASILKVTQFCITSVGHVYIFLSWDYFRCPKEGVCCTKTILMTG